MGYSNTDFTFNGDLKVRIIDSETGKKIAEFNAREFSEETNSASVVSGGIASFDQKYAIATSAAVRDIIEAYTCQAIISPDTPFQKEYKVLSTGISIRSPLKKFSIKKSYETVIYLG
ncbi:MAG: hypothetical protein IJQ23_01440 [Clostridia bacterium]|nr:hypothetical protein [Clostridia bacterium]